MLPVGAQDLPRTGAGVNLARYCLSSGGAAVREPDTVALVLLGVPGHPAGLRLSYAELEGQVRSIAGGLLAGGLRPGQRVLIRLGNSALTPPAFLGVLAAGLVAVPTSHLLTGPEAAALAQDCAAAAILLADDLPMPVPDRVTVVTPGDLEGWVAGGRYSQTPVAETAAEDPAFIVYTSGTEGRPKGVVHAHRTVLGRAPMISAWEDFRPGDVVLHAGALSWTFTLGVGLLDPWAAGATAVVYCGERPTGAAAGQLWWQLLIDSQATVFAAVPGVYRQLLAAVPRQLPRGLRHGLCAGEALAPALWEQWRAATGLPLYEALGMSEISTFVSSGPRVPTRPGSPGRPQPGRRIAVLPSDPVAGDQPVATGEAGLLAVHRSDPGLMLGYLDRPEADAATRRGEWFVSADLVHLDPEGYLHYHGRADDVLTAGGYRVSPAEVERVLLEDPQIAEVAVIEVESRPGVRRVTAFAVAEPAAWPEILRDPDAAAEAVLIEAGRRLAQYKLPRVLRWVESLPRTANGKLRRADLRAQSPGSR